ncbi:hypothetical protein FRX31_019863 [Thalictrum thalictroides]|uniref:Uncharacterized protein n=1 Tax=Thalictrum thalictroides TaxID=46969 RepID=A0A7J6W0T1_THATH|nr:hypothetical protein FRX31_019863 [Thalictrum thalictroides]
MTNPTLRKTYSLQHAIITLLSITLWSRSLEKSNRPRSTKRKAKNTKQPTPNQPRRTITRVSSSISVLHDLGTCDLMWRKVCCC